jgi:hypothetical protein
MFDWRIVTRVQLQATCGLTRVGCGLAEAGQMQTFERFLLTLGPAYIRTAVARRLAVQQQPLAALLHICTFLIRQYLI